MSSYDRYIVEQALEDAVESELFMCGMQPVSEESLCHGIYQCYPNMSCITPVETGYYVIKRTLMAADGFIRDFHLCALCANTTHDAGGRKIDPLMLTMYSVVLPICDACKSDGAKIVVGRFTHNGKLIQERLDQSRRREALAATS
jgi:hypothetical protein